MLGAQLLYCDLDVLDGYGFSSRKKSRKFAFQQYVRGKNGRHGM